MDEKELSLRRSVLAACYRLQPLGLSYGTSGNISVRCDEGMLITPSGVPYERMSDEDIVLMNFDGGWQGSLTPSTEWRFHLDILRTRKEINAIVHGHPLYATSLAICRREIPAVHYMIAAAGGPTIRCAEYATFGTQELSDHIIEAMQQRNCCLLANHGMIATGTTLEKAMWLASELENLAHQYVISLSIGDPCVLSDQEIKRNIALFKNYGPKQ